MSWLAVAASAVVALLTILVVIHPGPLPGEVAYIDWLQGWGTPVPAAAELVRDLTSTEAALIVSTVPAIVLIRRRRRSGIAVAAIALVAMLIVQPVFKEVVDRPRPTAQDVEVRADYESKSFPSGHSLSTTATWGALAAFAWRRRRRLVAAVVAAPVVLTFFASGVEGAHWPTDSIAGTLTGAFAVIAMLRAMPRTSAT